VRFGVIVFPGSNCDADCYHAVASVLGQPVEYVWHGQHAVEGFDCLILPGGFTYGDHLRPGAIARFSPIMAAVERFAAGGGLVLGICNGFQILCEAGLLPGALLRNECLQFRCEWVHLKVENATTPFTRAYAHGQVVRMPIAHGDGRYYADPATVAQLERGGRVVFRYCRRDGLAGSEANPNGSLHDIAGICNDNGNVLGLMPHPERCCEDILGGTDGRLLFASLAGATASRAVATP